MIAAFCAGNSLIIRHTLNCNIKSKFGKAHQDWLHPKGEKEEKEFIFCPMTLHRTRKVQKGGKVEIFSKCPGKVNYLQSLKEMKTINKQDRNLSTCGGKDIQNYIIALLYVRFTDFMF